MGIPFSSQHTPSFPTLLDSLGASVLVSTYQAGQLIILRSRGGALNTHFCALEKPMGLALHKGRLAVGTGYQLWDYANLPAVGAKLDGEAHHDACYLPRSVHITGNIDIHELAFTDDGELWFVNTLMSCLSTLDPQHSFVPRWRPPFITAYDLTDRCHLNGLALKDGQPAFVTALGATDSAAGWRVNKASGGLLMRVPDGQLIASGLSMPHSPRWYAGKLWYLESGAGHLSSVNLNSGRRTVAAELPGFTRGLDFVSHYAFVGLSQVRETAVFSGLPLTAKPGERHCGVWVVDISTGETVACVVFTGSVREVFAVQVLPHRFPVLLDIDDPLLRNSYSLPDTALAEVAQPGPLTLAFETAAQYHQQGNLEAAVDAYRHVLAQSPGHLEASLHLGVALMDLEQWQAAETELLPLLSLQPNHAEARNSLGLCLAAQCRWQEAIGQFAHALAADSQFAQAHVNLGIILLKLGRLAEGWAECEWRWQLPDHAPLACPQPRWQGEDISDKTLLVHTEPGAGDALLCARFLPLASQRCRRLLLVCTGPLRPLLANAPGVAEARLFGSVPDDSFEVYCPLLSLPFVLGISEDNLTATVPYLQTPGHVSVPHLSTNKRLKVGICWADSAPHPNDKHRSCPLSHWLPLFAMPEVAFFSLQTPVAKTDAEWLVQHKVADLEPELTDFARIAALMEQLDWVIGVDSAVIHLAGALGKPTWVLLGQHSDWHWGLESAECTWYPTMRLFRQMEAGDWDGVVGRIKNEWTNLMMQAGAGMLNS